MNKTVVFYGPVYPILELYKQHLESQKDKEYSQQYFTSFRDVERFVENHHKEIGMFVCGLHMTPKNGYEIASQFLKKYPDMPLIVLTTDVMSSLAYDVGNLANVLYVDLKENAKELPSVLDFFLVNVDEIRGEL